MKPVLRTVVVLVAVVLGGLPACKSSVNAQKTRYQQIHDRLEAFATKNPTMKADISAKLAEYDAAEKTAEGKGGDNAIKELSALNTRMEEYEKQLNPNAPGNQPPPGTAANGANGTPAGGKLGPGTTPTPVAPAPTPSGSGFGSGAAPPPVAPAPTPAPAPAPAPSGSGFGGH